MKTPVNRKRRTSWFLFLVLLTLLFLAALTSCSTKEDEIPTPIGKVKIFLSPPPSSSGLKSASTDIEPVEVAQGDTVTRPRDINIIMNSVDENGYPESGEWNIKLVLTDYSFMPNIQPLRSFFYYYGDQIANKFAEDGLYRISFEKLRGQTNEEEFYFFMQISAIPGKLGDGGENNFIFRLEKKIVRDATTDKLKSLLFAYYKYAKRDIKPYEAYCMLTDIQKTGFYPNSMVQLKKWPFNRDYYYLVIDPEKEGSLGSYQLMFLISDTNGEKGYADSNNYLSSWSNQWGQIEFAAY